LVHPRIGIAWSLGSKNVITSRIWDSILIQLPARSQYAQNDLASCGIWPDAYLRFAGTANTHSQLAPMEPALEHTLQLQALGFFGLLCRTASPWTVGGLQTMIQILRIHIHTYGMSSFSAS
jgi:hypothetical protein